MNARTTSAVPFPAASAAAALWVRAAVEQFEGPLTQYAARMLHGDIDRARDIVQDTFLKLWTADRAEVDGHLGQWLYRVCRNRALDVCRKESRMTSLAEVDVVGVAGRIGPREAASGACEFQSSGSTQEESNSVVSMLESLPDNQQEVLRLKFQGNLSYAEIANVMDLTANHVGVLIHNAIKALREKLNSTGEGSSGTARAKPQAAVDASTSR